LQKNTKIKEIRNWHYDYIGFAHATNNNGVLGAMKHDFRNYNNGKNVEITFEEFECLVLNKGNNYEIY